MNAAEDSRIDSRPAAVSGQDVRRHFVLEVKGVGKRFGAVTALKDVSLTLRTGEITALVGDNGAGKSTLVKLISGVTRADEGQVIFDGKPAAFASPAEARDAGIETVYQDLALAGNLPVWANMFLGRELTFGPPALGFLNKPAMIRRTQGMLDKYPMNVPPIELPVDGLSGGQRQLIAIARAAAWGSKLILMDEPTAALGVAETAAVEETIRALRDQGFSILIISHNLEQVFRLTDAVWVLRRGTMVGGRRTSESSVNEIVTMITGATAGSTGDVQ